MSTKQVLENEVGQVKIENVLPFLGHNVRKTFSGITIKLSSPRYYLFRDKGIKCTECGAKGSYFSITRSIDKKQGHVSHHLNLIGTDENGNKILMTKDHIVPKSKGGKNTQDNYQTMCVKCNMKKAAK